jgi:hypothetical protein
MIFRVAKLTCGHGAKTAGDMNCDAGCPLQAPPLHQAHCHVDDRFG